MGDKSSIEWLNGGATWNPIRAELLEDILNKVTGKVLHHKGEIGWFCIKISPGCAGCYACGMNLWRGNGLEYTVPNLSKVRIFLDEKTLLQPLRWKRPRLIFPCSMTDWMADFVPDEFRDKMLAVMALTPQHTYLTLTKRADRQREYFTDSKLYERLLRWADWIRLDTNTKPAHVGISDPGRFPLRNLWPGVSIEAKDYLERFDELLHTPAVIRWGSLEPLLGDLGDLSPWLRISWQCSNCRNYFSGPLKMDCPKCNSHGGWTGSHVFNPKREHYTSRNDQTGSGIDWIVAGGESGPKARPMHPDWVRSIRDQCVSAGVPFFFKQWGEYADLTNASPTERNKSTSDQIIDISGEVLGAGYRDGKKSKGIVAPGWKQRGGAWMGKVGKAIAGRKLDGREWNEYPEARS